MFSQVWAYIRWLLASTNQHGVHSPFIYTFVTRCLYDTKTYDTYATFKSYRKKLLKNKIQLEVVDYGAGSRVFNTSTRSVRALAKNAGARIKRQELLYRITNYFNIDTTLELGTSLGLATLSLAINKQTSVLSFEGCPNIAGFTQNNLKKYNLPKLNVKNIEFKKGIEKVQDKSFDLIYFDGNHSKEATLQYFDSLLRTKHNNSLWIFDDIYWSKEMIQAWETIKNHPEITVTVDCYWLGFVFFRKEQEKEHFKIRL